MDTYSDKIHIGRFKVHGAPVVLQKYERNALIKSYIEEGHTMVEAARVFKITTSRIREILLTHYPEAYKKIRRSVHTQKGVGEKKIRNSIMLNLYKKGYSISSIANHYKLHSGRAHQIIKREVARSENETTMVSKNS